MDIGWTETLDILDILDNHLGNGVIVFFYGFFRHTFASSGRQNSDLKFKIKKVMTNDQLKKELRLTDITRYDDVEMGRLELTVGEQRRSWKAIWLADLRCTVRGSHRLPVGVLPLSVIPSIRWVDCPRLTLNQRTRMWLVPLESSEWVNFGVDLYLCDEGEKIAPLSKAGYRQLVGAIMRYDISGLSVEPPRWRVRANRLNHDEGVGFDADFWNDSEGNRLVNMNVEQLNA